MRQIHKKPPLEHAEQVTLVTWWRTAGYRLPNKSPVKLYPSQLWAIPNGGTSNPIAGHNLNQEGRLAGVADLFLQVPVRPYHGLFLEMKRTKGGRQSADQKNFEALSWLSGYAYVLAHGFAEAQQAITAYLAGSLLRPSYADQIEVQL